MLPQKNVTSLTAERLKEAKKMQDEGQEMHDTGKQKESVEVLHMATDKLGLKRPWFHVRYCQRDEHPETVLQTPLVFGCSFLRQ